MSAKRAKKGRKKNTSYHSFDVADLRNPASSSILPDRRVQTQQISDDMRRRRAAEVTVPQPPPNKRRRVQEDDGMEPPDMTQDDFEDLSENLDNIVICSRTGKEWKRRFYTTSDEPLRDFQLHVDEYVEEFVRVDGRGDAADAACPTCPSDRASDPCYRCKGCSGYSLYCADCVVKLHAKRPFCRIERWDGESFQSISLGSLGLSIQLGHCDGEVCDHAIPVHKDFTVSLGYLESI